MPNRYLDAAVEHLTALRAPHRYGHTCTDGLWHNPNTGHRQACPVHVDLVLTETAVRALAGATHAAAHDPAAVDVVAEGMTGLVMADLAAEDAEGWRQAVRYAIEALAAHLDGHDVDGVLR